MSSANGFAAGVLEASASGYAGVSASLLLESNPDIADRWGAESFGSWKAHLTQRILELAAAMRIEQVDVFTSRVEWERRALAARDLPVADLIASLHSLEQVLTEQLPTAAAETVGAYLDAAIEALNQEAPQEPEGLDPETESGRLALGYLSAVLEGRPRQALEELLAAVDGGLDVVDAFLDVLLPAQREVGRLWHEGSASVAEEHLVTGTTERALPLLAARAVRAAPNGRRALVAAVEGNAHEVGIRILSELLDIRGWEVIYLGADVPTRDLVGAAKGFGIDVVLLSGSLSTHVRQLDTAVHALKALDEPPQVLVGGAAFDAAPDLWRKIGADGYAADLERAADRAQELVA